MPLRVFISYSHTDASHHAAKLEQCLDNLGITTWRDVQALEQDQDFTGEIECAIRESSHVLVCLTPDVMRKDSFVRREISYALRRKKLVIPLLFPGGELPVQISNLIFIDMTDPNGMSLVLERLRGETVPSQPGHNYWKIASSENPALTVFLLDTSSSMSNSLGDKRRIDVLSDAIHAVMVCMVQRSTKGTKTHPIYRVSVLAYNDEVHDLLGGVRTITEIAHLGVPKLVACGSRNTEEAFLRAERLLKYELVDMQQSPAPAIIHVTGGRSSRDPVSIARRIMRLGTEDGNVLIQNCYISDHALYEPITDIRTWKGVILTDIADVYAKEVLVEMSSPLPLSHSLIAKEMGLSLETERPMFYPCSTSDMLELMFSLSCLRAEPDALLSVLPASS